MNLELLLGLLKQTRVISDSWDVGRKTGNQQIQEDGKKNH